MTKQPNAVSADQGPDNVRAADRMTTEAVNEARILAALVSGPDDAEGMIAFALHRQAAMEWRGVFLASRKAQPDAEDYELFMLGEEMPGRIAGYKERAALLLAAQAGEAADMQASDKAPSAKQTRLRSIFWPWGITSGFRADLAEKPVNWRGLFVRLALLGLAVIVTALFFRLFVPKA